MQCLSETLARTVRTGFSYHKYQSQIFDHGPFQRVLLISERRLRLRRAVSVVCRCGAYFLFDEDIVD